MKRFVAVLTLAAAAAFGGDCMSGSGCSNACPLAKEAVTRMSTGTESVTVSDARREGFVRLVLKNLDAI